MENLLNILFPLKCINCNQIGEIICDSCLYDCELLTTQYCIVCDKPSFDGYTHKQCLEKLKGKAPTQLLSVYTYKDTVRNTIKTSKYGSKQFIALKKLTYEGTNIIREWEYTFEDFICVSIPSSQKKYAKRGFNQSEIITEIFAKRLKLPVDNSLITRTKETEAQYTLKRENRFENIKDAFATKQSEYLKDKKILLIDDVVTTGATLLGISNTLYESGVKEVKCITLSKKLIERKYPGT